MNNDFGLKAMGAALTLFVFAALIFGGFYLLTRFAPISLALVFALVLGSTRTVFGQMRLARGSAV